ncbi:hypothetical protein VULLAG_LOCUS778 [Vulpes lagopus]
MDASPRDARSPREHSLEDGRPGLGGPGAAGWQEFAQGNAVSSHGGNSPASDPVWLPVQPAPLDLGSRPCHFGGCPRARRIRWQESILQLLKLRTVEDGSWP